MKGITIFTTSACRCLTAAALLFVALLPAIANTSTYYYWAKVSVKSQEGSTTGGGLVYISNQVSYSPSYQSTSIISGNVSTTANSGSAYVYLYAQQEDNWLFDHWEKFYKGGWFSSDRWETITVTDDRYQITFDSEYENSPTEHYFRAVFRQQTGAVKVAVAEAGRGNVSINPENNVVGRSVTLSADPDAANGIHFLGWNMDRDDTENFVSQDNPYTFQITNDNKGTYYAHFSEAPHNIYCRIQNRATGRFIMLYGNAGSTVHTRTQTQGSETRTYNDGFVFTNSLKLISASEAKGNPMTVFLRSGYPTGVVGNTNNVNLTANHVEYNDVVTNHHQTTNVYPLTMQTITNSGVMIYTQYKTTIDDTETEFNSYLTDDGGDFVVMQSDASKNIYWDVYLLEEGTTEGSFGANAQEYFSGNGEYGASNRYYTTMFTYFPYQLMNGVKAYYLMVDPNNLEATYNEKKKEVYFTEITSGIVPMESAVVLECPAVYNNSNNRLLPLLINDNPGPLPGVNLLNGYISMSNEGAEPNKVTNKKSSMFILSKVDGDLGWFHFTADYMTPNKAFLDLSEYTETLEQNGELVRTLKFSFGKDDDNETTGIIAPKFADKVDVDGPLFDLNGRRVTDGDAYGLKKGVYISNGKKIVVK